MIGLMDGMEEAVVRTVCEILPLPIPPAPKRSFGGIELETISEMRYVQLKWRRKI